FDRLHDRRMAVTRDDGAERKIVVYVIIPIEIAEMRTLRLLHKDRVGIVGTVVAGNTKRDSLQITLMRCGRFRRALLVGRKLFLQFGIHVRLHSFQNGLGFSATWPESR